MRAQSLARKDGQEMDVARIKLLRGLLAQAAGVWSEADRLFENFILNAHVTIKALEEARPQNEQARKELEGKADVHWDGRSGKNPQERRFTSGCN